MKQLMQEHWSQKVGGLLLAIGQLANQWMDRPGLPQRCVLFYLKEKSPHGT